tara:strand:- start:454 stop:720 length:267 start_codon:yes stop_codon:yes gene_type:complete
MNAYYIGNYKLLNNSIPLFDIEEDTDEKYFKSSFNHNKYHKCIKNESISCATNTFIYLNKRQISMSVCKNPSKFKFLINNPVIKKFLV